MYRGSRLFTAALYRSRHMLTTTTGAALAKAAGYYKGPKDFMRKFVQRHLDAASLEMEIEKPIDVRLQAELDISLEGGMWADIDLSVEGVPIPSWGYFVPLGLESPVVLNGGPKSIEVSGDASRDQRGYGKSDNGLGHITWGVPILRFEQVYKGQLKANISLPGFAARIGTGKFKFDLLEQKGDLAHGDVDIHLEYLDGKIEISGDPTFAALWSVGPAFDVTLTPWLFMPRAASDWTDEHKYQMTPFAFGGAWDLVRFDLNIRPAPSDDPECTGYMQDRGMSWDRDGWAFGRYLRTGIRFYGSDFGQRIDTGWLGKNQKAAYAITGLNKSWRLYLICEPLENGETFAEHLGEKISTVWYNAQSHTREAVQKLNDKLQGLGRDREAYRDADETFLCGPRVNDTCLGWEAFKSYHNLHAPEDTEVYTPPLIGETTAECEADQAALEHINGSLRDCKNITTPANFNCTTLVEESKNETKAVVDVELCHVFDNCTQSQLQ
ncbi:hypothetical protein BST61_g2255 [Cercospora zeina]